MFTKNIEKIFLFLLFMLCANLLCPNEVANSIESEQHLSEDEGSPKKLFQNSAKSKIQPSCARNVDQVSSENSARKNSKNSICTIRRDQLFTELFMKNRDKQQTSEKLCDNVDDYSQKESSNVTVAENATVNQDLQNLQFLKKLINVDEKKLNQSVSSQNDSMLVINQNESSDIVGSLIKMRPSPVSSQDMLSFEEWRSKISEQMEKNKVDIKAEYQQQQQQQQQQPSAQESIHKENLDISNVPTTLKMTTNRARNFASHECGAKIVDSNLEANFVNRVLNEQMDEYMLNPCKAKNWFIVELCETIQPQYMEMANFELYSSLPKEFTVHVSEHYPNRNEWSSLGNFTANDVRQLQGFKLQNNGFVKYLKIEVQSFYGSEHYCPISLIRIFGTSLFDEVERIDNPDQKSIDFSNEDGDLQNAVFEETLQNHELHDLDLFGSAKNAVVNVVMKAFNFTLINQILFKGKHSISVNDSGKNYEIYNQSKILALFPTFEKVMSKCERYFFLQNTTQTLNIPKKCIFYRILFGDQLFELMSTQYLIRKYYNNYLFFQCGSNETILHFHPNSTIMDSMSTNDSVFADFPKKFVTEETAISNQQIPFVLEKFDTSSLISSTIQSSSSQQTNDVQQPLSSVNVTLEPSIADPLLMQTIIDTLPQSPSLLALSLSSTILSSISAKASPNNDSQVMINSPAKAEPSMIQPQQSITGTNNNNLIEILETNDLQSLSSMSGQSKEAVIIRLTSRIKNLEKNISLMSTYLENLSVRYRKQMEEMQKIFNQTIDHFNTSARIAAEKDLKQQEQIMKLQREMLLLNQQFTNVLAGMNQNNWMFLKIHIFLMIVEMTVVSLCCLLFYLGFKRDFNLLRLRQKLQTDPNVSTLISSSTIANTRPTKTKQPDHLETISKKEINFKPNHQHYRSKSLSDISMLNDQSMAETKLEDKENFQKFCPICQDDDQDALNVTPRKILKVITNNSNIS